MNEVMASLSGLIPFLKYFGGGVGLVLVFSLVYLLVTPYPEVKLIRGGSVAPAISFGGAIFGFICPLVAAISHSVSFLDMVLWALVALCVQVATFLIIRIFLPSLIKNVEKNQLSSAILIAIISIAVGMVNAASMTY